MRRKLRLGLCLLIASYCAASSTPLRLCLDFFPNPNHVPLYVALEADAGLDVDVIVPASPSDPVKLAAARAVDVCLTPQMNYLIARSEGLPLVAIGALVDHGLGGLLAIRGTAIQSLGDLAGRRIGYSLDPLEPILWRTMLRCAGVDASAVQFINVGFNTVAALLAGGVDAIGAFRNFEPIEIDLLGRPSLFFPQERYCVPGTYELLFVAHPDVVTERRDDLRALLTGVANGIAATRADPERAFAAFLSVNPDLDDELNHRAFEATLPLYADGARHDDPQVWEAMQTFLYDNGLIATLWPIESLYFTELLPEA